jgi:hypothetical protein
MIVFDCTHVGCLWNRLEAIPDTEVKDGRTFNSEEHFTVLSRRCARERERGSSFARTLALVVRV